MILRLLLLAAIAATPVGANAQVSSSTNLLVNPQFETWSGGVPTGWNSAGRIGSLSADPICFHDGMYSASITNLATTEYNQLFQTLPVQANTDYTVVGWVRGESIILGSGGLGGRVAVSDTAGHVFAVTPSLSGSFDWRPISVSFNSGNNTTIRIYNYLHDSSGTIWFDGMGLFQKLLVNGSFETWNNGAPTAWSASGRTGSLSADTVNTIDGTYSTKITNLDGTEYNLVNQSIIVAPGKDYVLTAWVKGSNIVEAAGGVGGRVAVSDANGNVFAASSALTGTFDWTEIQIPFNSGSRSVIRVFNYLHHSTGMIWFDAEQLNNNELTNPGFDLSSSTPQNWNPVNAAGETNPITIDSNQKQGGPYSLEISQQSTGSYSHVDQSVPVNPYAYYRLTFYSQTQNIYCPSGVGPRVALANSSANVFSSILVSSVSCPSSSTGGSPWTKYDFTFNTGSLTTLRIFDYLYLASGSVWFDSMTLEATKPVVLPLQSTISVPAYTDTLGNLMVDGAPFLPFGLYDVTDLSKLQGTDVNTVEIPSTSASLNATYLDAAKNAHIKVIIFINATTVGDVQSVVSNYSNYPAVLAWYIVDEPDGRDFDRTKLFDIYQTIKQYDPLRRPVLTSIIRPTDFWFYRDSLDILMSDPYPIPTQPLNVVYDQAAAGAAMSANPGQNPKGTFSTLQAFPISTAYPSTDQIRAMNYLALAGGSRGLLYYSFGQSQPLGATLDNANPTLWNELKAVATKVKSIQDVVAMATTQTSKTPDGAIAYAIKTDGTSTYIIAANSTGSTSTFSIDLGARPQAITDRLGTQLDCTTTKVNCATTDTGFYEKLGAYAVRVYEVNF